MEYITDSGYLMGQWQSVPENSTYDGEKTGNESGKR
jgi:hypothetical protein